MLWCQGAPNIRLSNINVDPHKSALYDHFACPSQTDRQMDEHHGNSAMIRSNDRTHCTLKTEPKTEF